MKLSVIIPVYHEVETIIPCLERVLEAGGFATHNNAALEIIVVDGAPEAETVAAVRQHMEHDSCIKKAFYAEILQLKTSPSGRAVQMNYGAASATGDVLLFLHVDTILPDNYLRLLTKSYYAGHAAGAFSLHIDDERTWFRVVEYIANKRNTWTRTPYGDQAQFFTAALFRKLGGYAVMPLMEDVDIMRRVRALGIPLDMQDECVTTSARRWHDEGLVYCSVRNVCLRTLYAFSVPAHKLAAWYGFEKRWRAGRQDRG